MKRLMILTVVVLAVAVATTALAGDWQGQVAEVDGVKHVQNPATPMHSAKSLELDELWRLGGDTDDEDEFFGVISRIMTDADGNVYLLDSQLNSVKIFNTSGEFVREIGREGEGPGEFRGPIGMFLTGDGNVAVMQIQPGKIVLLTPEGDPAGEHPIPKGQDGAFLTLVGGQSRADNLVLAAATNAFAEGKFTQTRYLCAIDDAGTETARYVSSERTINMGADPVLDEQMWDTFDRRWIVGTDGSVYAAPSFPNYEIHVWNQDGSMRYVIEREYDHLKRAQSEYDLVSELYGVFAQQIPGATVNISEWTKDIHTMYIRDDGSLWVLNSAGSRDLPDGTIGVFDVFDTNGHFVAEVTLQGEGNPQLDGYYFVGDRLYIVTDLVQAAVALQAGGQSIQIGEEEPEPMSVIAYEVDGDFLTSSR